MLGTEEWPSWWRNSPDRIRLTGPVASNSQVPRLRSGFRHAARTPRKRLNLQVQLPQILRSLDCARDFGTRLGRRVNASTYRSSCLKFSGPSTALGFRHAARTPRKRLNLQVQLPQILRSLDCARDFGTRLGRGGKASNYRYSWL